MRNDPVATDVRWWAALRVGVGTYLFVHFAALLPWGTELFSSRGLVADGSASPLLRLFPNVLALVDGPVAVTLLLAVGAAAALGLAFGVRDRVAAVTCWYVLACLLGRNPLIQNPSLAHVGWTLLAIAAATPAPPLLALVRDRTAGADWRMPASLRTVAWLVLGAAYTYSSVTKLGSASWLDGTALHHVLSNPLARPGALRALLVDLPLFTTSATYGALAVELVALPLACWPRARPWLWLALLGLQLGLLVLVDFADLTLGMIVVQAFVFDPAWLRRRSGRIDGQIREQRRVVGRLRALPELAVDAAAREARREA